MDTPKKTLRRARKLRSEMSLPEVILWQALRRHGLDVWLFRRQHPKGRYVLDFYCDQLKLAVEVDGSDHHIGDKPQQDARRDAWFRLCGIETLRIQAADVLRNMDGVHRMLQARAAARYAELKASPTTASALGSKPDRWIGGI